MAGCAFARRSARKAGNLVSTVTRDNWSCLNEGPPGNTTTLSMPTEQRVVPLEMPGPSPGLALIVASMLTEVYKVGAPARDCGRWVQEAA